MGALRRAALALAALLGVSLAVLEVHVGTSLVYSVEGQQAVLPVWYTSHSLKEPYITWMLNKEAAPIQILSVMGGKVKVEETALKSRMGFLYPITTHNISVFINTTREQDSGQYICSVNVEDDTVKNVGLINLTVLVPPAAPTCQLHGNAVVGANMTLSCSSKKGKPSPTYQWQREPPTLQVFFPPAQDRARGTLKLTNLSLEMSGVYVCRAENQAGSKNCSIVLEVHSSTKAVIAGAVLGSLGALATIIFFAQKFVGYRRKKRDSQEEGANEIKEDAVAPKTPSWVRRPASDTMSKTSTLSSIAGTRQAYGARAPSDTASILTTTGSYRGPPPRGGGRPPNLSPPAVNGTPRRRQDPAAAPVGSLPPSSLARAGAVPVMVPAQSRAGSLV
ncbi:endothelial cell-selective adhesion molecule-like isoform X2 [Motacilla alba alba]|uniref:endothelial cell-selective adhesion molecule-like isoform X2 n=1 Tax=Motacilla alba alba TaxID=1094192 RepID=UPI0018D4F766|nr:endothelial cell-selective adhesion molecule-like isoform X2 [Motacilla alba alba]